jgi:hypothetical protein
MKYTTFRLIALFILFSLLVPSTATADDIYLPIITNGQDGTTSATILPCTEKELARFQSWDGKTNTTPNQQSSAGCLLPMHGAPLDEPRGVPLELVNPEAAQVRDLFTTTKYSKTNLNCTTCTTSNGIASVESIHSAKEPYLSGGGSWSNYWYGNGTTVFNNVTITCQNGMQLPKLTGIGIGKGRLTSSINLPSPTIYSIVANTNYCYGFTTYYTIAPYSAIYFETYRETSNNAWTARAWLGSWYYVFVNDTTLSGPVQGVSIGQEVGAADSNFTYIKVPMNFAHKLTVWPQGGNRVPWSDHALPSYLDGKTTGYYQAPFNVMDIVAPDYTSISSEIN